MTNTDPPEGSMRVSGGIGDNLNYFQPMTGVTIQQIKPSPMLSLGPCGITIDLETGEVTIPAGMTLSEGARRSGRRWIIATARSGDPEPCRRGRGAELG